MTDVTLKEGSFNYKFTDVDWVNKLDDWNFHKKNFQSVAGGSRAVDFIAVKGHTCWLIECKDYRLDASPMIEEIALTFAKKFRDSLALLQAAKLNSKDDDEKIYSAAALKCSEFRFVAHIEPYDPKKNPKLQKPNLANLKIKIEQKTRGVVNKLLICETGSSIGIIEPSKIGH
ncbi:hypothetical protein [Jannaschia donghaensis]|uniref:hypothetical protein n=1 Tax=Jannaschia donghaensis TaxID=420998 RepID=UPI00118741C5|nr:hypothetical protein [Jannaschia donghaensis]